MHAVEKTTVYLPKELQQALRAASKKAGRPQADLIREALEQYLERSNQGRPLPAWVGSVDVPGTEAGALKRELRQRWVRELERRPGGP